MRISLSKTALALVATLAAGAPAVAATAASAAAPTRAQAERAALTALRARSGTAPLIVFRGGLLRPGTRIAAAGQVRLPAPLAGSAAARNRERLLRAAEVQVISAPAVATTGRERTWFFYADEAPFQAYQHPGRVVLVGASSGRVTVSRTLQWPPLLNGRLPYFLRSYAGYRNPRMRVFARLWRAGGAATRTADPLAPASDPLPAAGAQTAAAQLAAERSCVVRVGDTLGNFYDASAFDQTRAGVGAFFNGLAQLDSGFVSARYRVASGTSLRRYVARLIADRGCRDVLLYLAGGGYVNGGEPAISVGIQGRADGRLEQQAISATLLRAIVADHPSVTFKLQLDAPGSGAVLSRLDGLPNLLLFLASSKSGRPSFTALPGLAVAGGGTLRNDYNADGLLEFSNRGLRGLRCFVADPAEVAAAAADKAAGRSRSFLAAMLWRAYQLCGEGSLLDVVAPGAAAPVARLVTPTTPAPQPPAPNPPAPNPPVPNPPTPGPPTPPAQNGAPTAAPVAVETDEDAAVSLTLAGADPDGDPLSYALAAQPANGTVSGGDGAARTFTPDPNWNGETSFDYTVSDGRGGSATATVTVTVAPVADPPVLSDAGGALTFTEGDSPLELLSDPSIGVVDTPYIASATISISSGYESGADALIPNPMGSSFDETWDAASGTLTIRTISGRQGFALYETMLAEVRFANGSTRPSDAPRTISFTVTDENGAVSAPLTRSLTVVPTNVAPTLGGISATPLSFTEGDAPLALATAATIGDADDPRLGTGGVTIAIGDGFAAGEDSLAATDAGDVTSSWDAATGLLRLTGDASPADYQLVLRTVTYANDSETPSSADRTVTITVDDGSGGTTQRALQLGVTAVDDAPVVRTSSGATSFTGSAVAIDPDLTVADPDSTTLTSATVTIAAGGTAADVLAATDANGITSSYDAATGALSLSGTASLADYQAVLRTVTFSRSPLLAGTRTIAFSVSNSLVSNAPTKTVALAAPPVVTLAGGGLAYTEGDGLRTLDATAAVSDADSARLAGITVAITAGYDSTDDELSATVGGTAISAVFSPGTGTLALTGDDTVANYQRVLRTVAFRNDSQTISAAARTVTVTADDGVLRGTATTTITVTAVDSPPVVTATGGAVEYVENDASGVAIDSGLTISDVDSPRLSGAAVAVSANHDSADELLFADQSGISGSYDAGAGELTLSGDATVAAYQAALRSVRFRTVGDAPSTATRTISFTAADATSTGAAATKSASVRAVDDAPVITAGATLAYTENDAATAIDPALTISDPDSARLAGATVVIDGNWAGAQDELGFVNGGGISGSYNPGSGVLTLTGDATVAAYQAALRSVTYRNSSDRPSTADRGITFTVDDGALTDSDAAVVTVAAVDDAPSAAGVSSDTVGNTRLAYGTTRPSGRAARVVGGRSLLEGVSDVDTAGPFAVVAETVATADGGSAAINADGTFDYTPAVGATGSDSFTYRVAAASAPSVVGSGTVTVTVAGRVWYVDNAAAAGGVGRSQDPFDTLAEAVGASSAGDTIYLFGGDGTTTGTSGTATLKANQRLLGERSPLVVGGAALYDGDAAERPQVAGQISLAAGTVVRGLRLLGGVSGTSISSGSGSLDDLVVTSAGGTAITFGVNGGSSWTLSDLDVSNTNGDAITIVDGGAVTFAATSEIDLSAGGAGRALTASDSTVSGQIDSLSTSGTASGGAVWLTRVTGPLTLDDLDLRTTDASAAGLLFDDTTRVAVNASGDGRIDSAGPAVALRTSTTTPVAGVQPQVALNSVRSTGGTYGVELNDVGDATFSAATGSLSGQSSAAFAITGGSGDVTYGGTIGDGTGSSVSISGRSGGAIRFGGAISDGSDTGGGIAATGIGGGSIAFTAAGPTLSTGTRAAVDLGFSGAASVSFSGGSTVLTTTSGDAFSARTSNATGTVSVAGSGNVARSTAGGAALRIDGPDIAAAGVRFQSLASSGAVSGLVLRDSGNAGGLTVTGDGALGSGGTLAGSTGPGADLAAASAISLTDMRITGGADDGIRAAGVNGMTLTRPTLSDNGDASGENNVELSQPSGTIALAGANVTRAGYRNLQSTSTSGTAAIAITGGAWGLTTGGSGDDSVNVNGSGSSVVGLTVDGADFAMSGGDHIQVTSDAVATSTLTATVRNAVLSGVIGAPGGGITFNPGGSASLRATVSGNTITGAALEAITIATPGSDVSPQPVTIDATIAGNTIGSGGAAGSGASNGNGIGIRATGGAAVRTAVTANQIRQYSNTAGIRLQQSDLGSSLDATVTGNTLAQPNGVNALYGLYATSGSGSGADNGLLCLDARSNVMSGSGVPASGGFDLLVRRRDQTTVRLPGYAGAAGDATQLAAFLSTGNGGAGASVGAGGAGFTGAGSSCAAPL